MEKLSFHVCFCSIFCAFLLVSRLAISQEVEDETEFDYNEEGEKGPTHWGDLKPEWHSCKTGEMQSPIDLLHERVRIVSLFTDIDFDYKPTNATLKNRGHDIMLKLGHGAGYMVMNRTRYFLQQIHWHSPSEHTINGKRFALEAHLVHQSQNGNYAVIGVVYKIGRPDSFLSKMKENLEEISNTHEEKALDVIDLSLLEMQSSLYYRYIGSLTTPPCSQNVLWTIVRKVRTVTVEQIKLLRVAAHDDSNTNARPLQPINDRKIQLRIQSTIF
ncbi:hypothetical protein IC582_028286 [Cucumis melo]|uniref:Carbonic anhydrase n=1 Tax=Cucumis melo TaxID=3656 RepID=A0A1S3CIB7_CUCME|nr:alpha carbonic anhydrase 7-like [Cucumis melo]